MDSLAKKHCVDEEIHQIIQTLTETNLRQENMHKVEVKLSVMHLGGRKRVLYSGILKLVSKEICASAFCTFMAKYAAFRKMSPDS